MNNEILAEQYGDSNHDFLVGDLVVVTDIDSNPKLFEFLVSKGDQCCIRLKSKSFCVLIALSKIRHATVAEISANRRLTNAEMALGEVS